jgi:CheY-like chemotaxis protein
MTGTEFFVELRRFLPDVPVVLMTGFAERSDGLASRLSLLPKPFDQAPLAKAIARHLRAESAAPRGGGALPFRGR